MESNFLATSGLPKRLVARVLTNGELYYQIVN